jgi:hypothetical protein
LDRFASDVPAAWARLSSRWALRIRQRPPNV